jgi:hypothetical protein
VATVTVRLGLAGCEPLAFSSAAKAAHPCAINKQAIHADFFMTDSQTQKWIEFIGGQEAF